MFSKLLKTRKFWLTIMVIFPIWFIFSILALVVDVGVRENILNSRNKTSLINLEITYSLSNTRTKLFTDIRSYLEQNIDVDFFTLIQKFVIENQDVIVFDSKTYLSDIFDDILKSQQIIGKYRIQINDIEINDIKKLENYKFRGGEKIVIYKYY
ncbi:MAG: hypothetical protein NZZ41_05000 [Candidatus Dojkabacteria bacterium]|nr:hypothetical protein [Candidatus Dojkabacteria bacterium]